MTPDVARKLNYLANDPHQLDALTSYARERIDTLKEQLASEIEVDAIRRLQGSIRELRRFATLRDEVNDTLRREHVRSA